MPFGLTQALGIYAAWRFLPQVVSIQPISWSGFSAVDFVILAAFLAVFIIVTTKFERVGSWFFRFFLSLLIFSGAQAIFGIWFDPLSSTIVAIIIMAVFWFFQNIITQNIAMILAIAGLGAVLGLSLLPISVVYILIIFSIYDIISVYKTGHMIKLAQAMIRSRAIFGFVVPEIGRSVGEKIANVEPGQGFMILGSGDVIFPLLLSASIVRISILQSIVVGMFSILGLFLMHLIFTNQKIKRPMAALPPIALMSIIGYLIASFIL